MTLLDQFRVFPRIDVPVPLTENPVIILDISVAWVQGNNVVKRHFFHKSHLGGGAMAKKGFSILFHFLT